MTALQEIIFGVALLTVGLVLECAIDEWRSRRRKKQRESGYALYKPVRLVVVPRKRKPKPQDETNR